MNKNIKIVVILLVLGVVGFFAYTFMVPKQVTPNIAIGGEKDSHGCLGPAGYSWCEGKNKCLRVFEEFCLDQAGALVAELKNASGVQLISTTASDFIWYMRDGDNFSTTTINGVVYEIKGIKRVDYQKMEDYMTSKYGMDISNIADGVKGGLRGYVVGYMVCDLNFEHDKMKNTPNAPSEPIGDSLNVWLSCGYFNRNNLK